MKLIMIMGMQRSGSTALFDTLRTAPRLISHAESPDGPIYNDYFLRPESAIRHLLRSSGSHVLLKPVRESERRTLVSVIDEYADYDLSILWLYRDPVNVVFSYSVKGWLHATTLALEWVALEWIARNRMLIQLPDAYRPKLTVLRYENLVRDGLVLRAVQRKLGIRGQSKFRPDSNAGRAKMPIATQARIDAMTSGTLLDLDRFPTGLDFGRISWRRKRAPTTAPPGSRLKEERGAAHAEALRAGAVVDFQSDRFQRDPHACLRRLREYRLHHHSESGNIQWLSDYDEVACALHDSERFVFQGGSLLRDGPALGEQRLRDAISCVCVGESTELAAASLESLVQEVLTQQMAMCQFDLADVCRIAVAAMFYRMLGVTSCDADGLFERTIRGDSIEALSSCFLGESWISRVAMQASLSSTDLRRFLEFGSYYHYVTVIFALTAVHFLLQEPAVLKQVRRTPDRFPATFTELARLTYPLLVVERWTSGDVEVAGRLIPAHHLVYLSIAAANRDPAVFDRPEEFLMERGRTSTKKPLAGYTGACVPRAHWEEWGYLACETLLKVLLTKFPVLEPVRPLSESQFAITQSIGALREVLQIPFLRYLQTFDVKFQS